MAVPEKIPIMVPVKGKRGTKKLKLVRAKSNEELIARILNFNDSRGSPGVNLRINFQIFDPEAGKGKGNHAGLKGAAFSLKEMSYEEIALDIKRIRKLFE